MTTVALWSRKIREAKKKTDELSVETDVRATTFHTKQARLAIATDRAEAAAVEFVRQYEQVKAAAAIARQKRA